MLFYKFSISIFYKRQNSDYPPPMRTVSLQIEFQNVSITIDFISLSWYFSPHQIHYIRKIFRQQVMTYG